MAYGITGFASLVLVVVILASVIGAVKHEARYYFVGGLGLFILAHLFNTEIDFIPALLALIGVVLAMYATVPLLRQEV